MAIVRSDNPEIEKELVRLEGLIEESGGGMHSDIVLTSENGNLTITADQVFAPGKEIIRVARGTLLPSDQYDLSVKDREFVLGFPKNTLMSAVQRNLTECMITLYNLTKKVPQHIENSFQMNLVKYPELMDFVFTARTLIGYPLQWNAIVKAGMDDQAISDHLPDNFLKTRVLGYNDHIRSTNVSTLMPLIDFLNHHWAGAMFNVGGGTRKGDLAILGSQPVPGDLEFYAFYGPMDALDALFRYDFPDALSPVIRSVPLNLEVPGHGTIEFSSYLASPLKKQQDPSIADLHRFMPTFEWDKEKRVMTASHILIPIVESPLALRRVLAHLYKFMVGTADDNAMESWVRDAESIILDANKKFYADLEGRVDAIRKEQGSSSILDRLSQLSQIQLGKLDKYTAPQQLLKQYA